MPLFHDEPSRPELVVGGSVAVELDWALAAASRLDFRRDHAVLARAYENAPRLAERVRSFWSPEETTSCGGSIELMILAHHGGVLFSTDPDELLSQLEDLCADAPLDLRLASEDANDRAALLRRLARLRGSADVRRNYADLVRDVWAVVATDWLRDGERAVAAAVAERRDLLRRGASWREVARDAHCSDAEVLFSLVEGLGPQGAIGLVPAYFAHLGSLVDLPGMVLIGVRADGSGAQARARTELLARRLKTISDPTRLAMLEALRSSPRTVSELAHLFSLAQPTVSNHVKVLRESGLVANGSDGDRRKLMLQPDVLTDLIDHLSGILAVRAADVH